MTDKFRYDVEHHEEFGGWSIVVNDPCPRCGNDVVFNGKIEEYCQYVGYDQDEDGNQICGPDDTVEVSVEELRCGDCGLSLV